MRTQAEIQRDELQALAHERLGLIAELEARVRDLERQVAQAQATTRNYRKRAQRARRQRDELRARLEQATGTAPTPTPMRTMPHRPLPTLSIGTTVRVLAREHFGAVGTITKVHTTPLAGRVFYDVRLRHVRDDLPYGGEELAVVESLQAVRRA